MGVVITGWGKCLPPAVLTNRDLEEFMDTNDEWIVTRTGISERRISHVGMVDLAATAAASALATAGYTSDEFDCIIVATASPDLLVPNTASRVQLILGNEQASAFDINVGCCGFVYGLAIARGLVETGVHARVVVIGAERLSQILNWTQRDSAILFGDGAGAVVVEAVEGDTGLLSSFLACNPGPGHALMATDLGTPTSPPRERKPLNLQFDGREVFRHAVPGMAKAAEEALASAGFSAADIDIMVPHQANLRIVASVGTRLGIDESKVITNLQHYGNTSAASIPIALCEALESGRIAPGNLLLFAAFGAGLTSAAAVLRWGERITPLGESKAVLPECRETARELIQPALAFQQLWAEQAKQ